MYTAELTSAFTRFGIEVKAPTTPNVCLLTPPVLRYPTSLTRLFTLVPTHSLNFCPNLFCSV